MYTASCLCGGCVIEFDNIIGTGLCYCTTCRKMTSSLFSMNTLVPTPDLHLKSGTPKTRPHQSDSGAKSTMHFCADCGGIMWMEYEPRPDFRIIKSGIIDGEDSMRLDALRPKVEQFAARRPPWLCPIEGAVQEPGQQPIKKSDEMVEELKSQM